MKILGLILLFLIIALIDAPAITKKPDSKVKYSSVYCIIYLISFILSLLQIIGKAPASPSKVIQTLVKGIIGGV